MKTKMPPFNRFSRAHYWLGYTTPIEMVFMIAINGKLDIEKLKQAAKKILLATPVFQTKITSFLFFIRRKFLNLAQDFDINQIFSVDYEPKGDTLVIGKPLHEATVEIFNNYLDITKQLPIYFYIRYRKKDKAVFYVKINHSVADGIGSYIFISKIIQEYNNIMGGKNTITLPAEPDSYSLTKLKKLIKHKKKKKEHPQKNLKTGFLRDQAAAKGTVNAISYLLTQKEFSALKKFSKESGLSINDIIFSSVAIASYKSIIKRQKDIDQIIIELPINLRNDLKIKGGIGNFISIIQIPLTPSDFKDNIKLFAIIKEKLQTAIQEKEHISNIFRMPFIGLIPSKLIIKMMKMNQEKILASPPPFTTAVSNPGSLDYILETPYNCEIEYAWASTHPHYAIGKHWGPTTFRNNLVFCLVYMDPVISDETAKNEMDMVLKEFNKILQIDPKKIKAKNQTGHSS